MSGQFLIVPLSTTPPKWNLVGSNSATQWELFTATYGPLLALCPIIFMNFRGARLLSSQSDPKRHWPAPSKTNLPNQHYRSFTAHKCPTISLIFSTTSAEAVSRHSDLTGPLVSLFPGRRYQHTTLPQVMAVTWLTALPPM